MAGKSTNPRKFTMNIYYGDESKKYIDEFFKCMARIKVDAIMDEMERQKLSKEEKIKVLNQLIEEESKKEHITEHGDCYHYRKNCVGLKRTVYKITLAQAEVYRACSRCVGGN